MTFRPFAAARHSAQAMFTAVVLGAAPFSALAQTEVPAGTEPAGASTTAPAATEPKTTPAPNPATTDAWQFEITPYLLGAGLNGETGIATRHGDVTSDIDMSFSDVLEKLDSGFMALFEARKGLWFFAIEGVYFKLDDEKAQSWAGPLGNTTSGALQATTTEQLYQVSIGYRVLEDGMKVDLLGAGRYTQLDTDLDLAVTTGSPLLPDGSRSVSASESWWDPVIGVRALVPLAAAWTLVGYADVGGFGVGSDLTYQLLAGVNWQFSNSVSAKAGYRYIDQDYAQDGFIWDMVASGFYLGVGIQF